jgi:uncharacterized PurR-regulated membrane protein YhhQ (DUF165 family)
MLKIAITAAFLACILAANYVTTHYGMVPVGFGLIATAGTYFAGLTFVLRDSLQDVAGKRWTLAAIAAGAALSFLVSDPFIALASAVAFGLAELADLLVYTPLRKRGYIRAAVASNIVGSFVDTIVFLTIAGFPLWVAFPGQMVGKLAVTVAAATFVAVYRTTRRKAGHRMNPETVPIEATAHLTTTATIQHMCPFVHEVDNGTITIAWHADGWTLELHSLRAYLDTFSDREISHEELTEEIRAELSTSHGINEVTVNTKWRTAGMEVRCSTSPIPAGQP